MNRSLPRHIAIIMDGNGRWARARALPRLEGHRQGVKALRRVVEVCGSLGVEILTVYAFSTENWKRPAAEVAALMRLLRYFARRERSDLVRQNVRLRVIGDISPLPRESLQALEETMSATAKNTGLCLQLAINYGGREEVLRAIKTFQASGEADLTEESFGRCLDTAGQVDPDLVIRTSGELRLSNFLIWQTAYSEFYFTETLWPDFGEEELEKAIGAFEVRHRRFGGLG